MFSRDKGSSDVTSVLITRTRNGFIMSEQDLARQGLVANSPYVFNDLRDLYDFLIENDFEVTDE